MRRIISVLVCVLLCTQIRAEERSAGEPPVQAIIEPEVVARVTEVCVAPKQQVDKDTPLVKLDDTEAKELLAMAELRVREAELLLQRSLQQSNQGKLDLDATLKLAEKRMTSDSERNRVITQSATQTTDVSLAKVQLSIAQSNVRLAKARLEKYVLKAPFKGCVTKVSVYVGEVSSPDREEQWVHITKKVCDSQDHRSTQHMTNVPIKKS